MKRFFTFESKDFYEINDILIDKITKEYYKVVTRGNIKNKNYCVRNRV